MKTAIVFGTRKGATKDSAELIARILREKHGVEVTVFDAKHMPRADRIVAQFDSFVVGSSITSGRWVPAARRFLAAIGKAAGVGAPKPVAVFVSAAGTFQKAVEGSATREEVRRTAVDRYIAPVVGKLNVTPVATNAFGGRMIMFRESIFDNWSEDEIGGWADEIAPLLGVNA